MSTSQTFREQGNRKYASATDGLSPAVKISRLTDARNLYYKALNVSDASDDEKGSAAKNIGMCEWRLGNVTSSTKEKPSTIAHHFLEALKYFKDAISHGNDTKPSEWTHKVSESLVQCYSDAEKLSGNFDAKYRRKLREEAAELTANVHLQIATTYFHRGIEALEKNDHKLCLNQMAETQFPMNECERLCKSEDFLSEVSVLRTDVWMHTCLAESVKARITGDSLLDTVIKDQETINVDMIWDIVDWYRSAILLTRDLDMEAEAIAYSRLGKLYDQVLKLKVQAKQYYTQALSLAESMHPRTFNDCDWYKSCAAAVKKYQEETVQHEQEKEEKDKEKYKEELKEEFEELKVKHERSQDHVDFLRFVYARFPPKNPEHTLPKEIDSTDKQAFKKLLQTSVVHYHPDRSDPEKNGMKWKVLSEQITKYLTNRYESIKLLE